MRVMLWTIGLSMAAATLPALPAHAAPPGTYLRTCNAVRDEGPGRMSAQCRDVNGRYRFSGLDYRGCRGDIGNDNGRLVCAGGGGWGPGGPGGPGPGGPGWGGGDGGFRMPAGSWRETCRGRDMRGPMVFAQCQGIGGRWRDTRIDVRDCRSGRLANLDGRLVCDR
jgi:hypothetical protein